MAVDVTFVVNPAGYQSAFKSWNGSPVGRYMREKTALVKAAAILEAPGPGHAPVNTTGIIYGTGALKASIISTESHHMPGRDLEGHVIALAKHALWVHNGTRGPYVIKPKSPTGHLRFFDLKRGHMVITKRVIHPGVRIKQPFLLKALKRAI